VRVRVKPRIAVIYNRDFEGAEADPENRAREDIKNVAVDVMRALGARGHEVHGLGVGDDVHGAIAALRSAAPAVVFNLCESLQGDNRFEALVPLLMELEGFAYTGSGPLALTLALHKHKTKEVLRARGVPTPRGLLVDSADISRLDLRYPLMVKPACEDASVGICGASVVRDAAGLEGRVRHVLAHYQQPALVEEFIEGREINASVLQQLHGAPEVLPLFEIDFSQMPSDRPKIVSFEGKWIEDSPEFRGTRPVRCQGLAPALEARVVETALAAFAALELRDYGRVDIRLSVDGVPYVIDVNPNCDLSDSGGGFARAARAAGLGYDDLVVRLLSLALGRRKDADTISFPLRSRRVNGAHRPAGGKSVSARGSGVRPRASRGRAEPG
jgi:D-alanine-D-alanine ligase